MTEPEIYVIVAAFASQGEGCGIVLGAFKSRTTADEHVDWLKRTGRLDQYDHVDIQEVDLHD